MSKPHRATPKCLLWQQHRGRRVQNFALFAMLSFFFGCVPLAQMTGPDSAAADSDGPAIALLAATGGGSADGSSPGGSIGSAGGVATNTLQLGAPGAGSTTTGEAVIVDSAGNIFVGGHTNGNLGGVARTGLIDLYLTKYNSSGNRLFTRLLGTPGKPSYGTALATDSSDNVYITGHTLGSLDGQIQLGTWDMYLVKYDNAGHKQWTRQLGAVGSTTTARSIAIESGTDNIYVAGFTRGQLSGEMRTGKQDMFLIKFDASGHRIWTRLLGAPGSFTWAQNVALDSSGNPYITGYTSGGLDGNTQIGTLDIFIAKYDGAGNRLFTKQLGAPGKTVWPQGLAVDGSGNSYITGYTSADLDGNLRAGFQDMFLTAYDSSGTKRFTKMFGVAGASVQGLGAICDSAGQVYITGYTNAGLDGNLLAGTADAYLAKYDGSGTRLFVRQIGVAGAGTNGRSLAVAPGGLLDQILLVGNTSGGLDGNALMGGQDFFVARYDANGIKQ